MKVTNDLAQYFGFEIKVKVMMFDYKLGPGYS